MKTLLISMAAAAVILAAPAAFAADNDQPKDKTSHVSGTQSGKQPKGNPNTSGGQNGGKASGSTGTSQTGNPNASGGTSGGKHHQHNLSGGGTTQGNATNGNGSNGNGSNGNGSNGNGSNGKWPNGNGHNANGQNGNARTHNGGKQAATNLRHYHQDMRAKHRFRIGSYHGPRGYRYRHWTFGMTLPEIYFAQDYWISDYDDYGLDDPPDGYTWVRFGPDALLIDEDTGEIVEVEYGVFY